ncbi:DUF3089 domain-containing protein [Sphingomonas carotinifaciens]|uniref:DUF3089 domain-containing protein n=1 Tax=Sphingomonas carotinifaciens TaxID=1166323 RepID=UPI000DD5751E|nr:DUF3089 domain-containing protein [Sphingomonas carotinifaciens]
MARKFLYVVAGLIVLAIAATFAYRLFGNQLLRWSTVPGESFRAQPAAPPSLYDRTALWLAHPELPNNPAQWTPAGHKPGKTGTGAAIFFIHPTSYISKASWNAPLDDAETNERTALFLRGQASAFNAAGDVWAPRYRQATFGAFLTSVADAERALALAYGDIDAAFDSFVDTIGPDRPIILAGHSQGALHLTRLLRDRVAGNPALARRIVAAYVVGWPVSVTTDLPRMGLPACGTADQTGCILSWQTFAEPADPSLILDVYDQTQGFNGAPRRDTPMLCTNPLTGTPNVQAPATANLGTLYPSPDLKTADLLPNRVAARCGDRGFLLIGDGPNVGPYVLPGNNYHVYDYSLFWANVRADANRRLAAFAR